LSGSTGTTTFDPINRLVERQIQPPNNANPQKQFHYNGLNRLAAAVTGDVAVERHFDSLSRLLAEAQPNGTVQYAYDGAGNRTHVAYPGGQQIRKTYDVLNRVSEVREGQDN
jgi:YD repeat-containing protein